MCRRGQAREDPRGTRLDPDMQEGLPIGEALLHAPSSFPALRLVVGDDQVWAQRSLCIAAVEFDIVGSQIVIIVD